MSGVAKSVKNVFGGGGRKKKKSDEPGKWGVLSAEEQQRISKARGRVGGFPAATLLSGSTNERLGG
jgi:hypothetical protein